VCEQRPSAGGNIRGRRRAELSAQVFDHYGWRCVCCGWGDAAGLAHREKLFGRDAETYGMHRWLRDDYKGTGEWCTLAHVDGKMRC
jgi:hypothetical protein